MEKHLGVGEPQPPGEESPEIFFSPYEAAPQKTFFSRRLHEFAEARDLPAIYRGTSEALSPATDDQPFFNQRQRWRTLRPHILFEVLFPTKGSNDGYQPVAEVYLLLLFAQSVVIGAIFILLPLVRASRAVFRGSGRWSFLAYFAALGLGFIMVEIALLQRFLLFLGQPIYTYAVVLAGLLIFTGAGSYAAGKWNVESTRTLKRALLIAVLVVLLMAVITPLVFRACLGFGLPFRITIALLLVAPLGFVLGMPFPLGLRLAMQRSSALGSWAWGVNGFFTVIGTVLALMLGMMIGFRMVLLLACACYLGGLLAITWLSSGRTEGGAVTSL
jgi:hypothetical protein